MQPFSRLWWRALCAVIFVVGFLVGAESQAARVEAAQPRHAVPEPSSARFNTPYGITFDTAGNVYVVDSSADKVIKLSKTGKVLEKFGKKGHGPGQFDQPEQVAVDRSGTIYVSDYGDDRVERFSPAGKFLGQWGKKGASTLFGVHGVAAGPDGNIYMGTADGVVKYSAGGKHLATYSIAHVGFVHGVTLDGQGNIYTSDWNGHVTKLSPRGKMLVQWHNNKKTLGGTNFAEGMAVSSAGTVYVADSGNDRIDTFNSALRPLGLLGKASGGDPGQFSGPNGIAVGPDGDIYVADSNNSRVQKLSPSGRVLAIWT